MSISIAIIFVTEAFEQFSAFAIACVPISGVLLPNS